LVPCGHTSNGKASQGYQLACALLARNGLAALIYDPIDQGERGQMLTDEGKPPFKGVAGHDMLGIGSILVGRNTARYRIWDGMRSIDYLQSRPEVDGERIGCTGNSGGGTMTSYLMALDDRVEVAAPSCYLTTMHKLIHTIGPQDAEQCIHGQLGFVMEHADYIHMRAPKPTLMCVATNDFFDIEGAWTTFRHAKRLYTRMGFGERVGLIENDAKHGFTKPLREGAVRWMMRWLLDDYEPITEPEIEVLGENEIQCTPDGQVMRLDGARSAYHINADYERDVLAPRRRELWGTGEHETLRGRVRELAGIRELGKLPELEVNSFGKVEREDCTIEKLVLIPEPDVFLAGLLFVPKSETTKGPVLFVHEDGKAAEAAPEGVITQLVESGHAVLAIDLRGMGKTKLKSWRQMNIAYLLGRSFMGMRAEDVLVAARYLAERTSNSSSSVSLVAVGHVGVPALHAAALEPKLFNQVKLVRTLKAWSNAVTTWPTENQWPNVVHAALTAYDLPDLARLLGKRVTIESPVDPRGEPLDEPTGSD
ncbi:MAG: prolyl oligopeptidase family serine peptidase, partial [Planctomycetota bacterium]